MPLLSRSKVAAEIGCPEGSVHRLMASWGVPTVSLGVGRGLGDRWDSADIEEALKRVKAKARKMEQPRRRKGGAADLWERGGADILRALTPPSGRQ
jgi:hypothetical protein